MFTKLITSIGSRQTSKFDFGFEIIIGDQAQEKLLIFVNTKEEFNNWTRLFSLIVEMNEKKIPVTLINPFDYEQLMLKRQKERREKELPPQVPTQRPKRQPAKIQTRVTELSDTSVSDFSMFQNPTLTIRHQSAAPQTTTNREPLTPQTSGGQLTREQFMLTLQNIRKLGQKRQTEIITKLDFEQKSSMSRSPERQLFASTQKFSSIKSTKKELVLIAL